MQLDFRHQVAALKQRMAMLPGRRDAYNIAEFDHEERFSLCILYIVNYKYKRRPYIG